MTIAIECAIAQEHAHLAAALKHHETVSVGGQRFDRGDLDGREVVLALPATVDGQTTAHYIAERLADAGVSVTSLARGVPVGGDLDWLDDGTIIQAMRARRPT